MSTYFPEQKARIQLEKEINELSMQLNGNLKWFQVNQIDFDDLNEK